MRKSPSSESRFLAMFSDTPLEYPLSLRCRHRLLHIAASASKSSPSISMESVLFSSPALLHLPTLRLHSKSQTSSRSPLTVCCGLRRGAAREPLWRGKVMSIEAIQAVQALKLAKSSQSKDPSSPPPSRLANVFKSRIGRLLNGDLVAVLAELQRQNEWEIALKVFDFMRKEESFRLNLSLYGDMILMLGKNGLIEMAEQLLSELKKEGLQPDTRVYTEMIGAYFKLGMVDNAMDLYKQMKGSNCNPDRLTLTILIRNLEKAGEDDLACAVRKDCEKYIDYSERFLEEVDRTYPKRRSLKLV